MLQFHTEKEVRNWFQGYYAVILKYNIKKGKNLLNIDKSGVKIGCPARKKVIVLVEVTNLYALSPKNPKLVTVFKTVYPDG